MASYVWGGKERYGTRKKVPKQNRGGKAPPPPKETSQRIIELIGDEPGFSGIEGGIESGE